MYVYIGVYPFGVNPEKGVKGAILAPFISFPFLQPLYIEQKAILQRFHKAF
jgi:hypothetical protein